MFVETTAPFRRVVGTLIRGVGSGLVAGAEGIPLAGATVTATASIRSAKSDEVIVLDPVVGTTDNRARLRNAATGEEGLPLLVTDDDSIGVTGWTWHFVVTAPTLPRPWEFDIPVPAGEGDLDLASVIEVPANPGEDIAEWVRVSQEAQAVADSLPSRVSEALVADPTVLGRIENRVDASVANKGFTGSILTDGQEGVLGVGDSRGRTGFMHAKANGEPTRRATRLMALGATETAVGAGAWSGPVDAKRRRISGQAVQLSDGMLLDKVIGDIRARMSWRPAHKVVRPLPSGVLDSVKVGVQSRATEGLTSLGEEFPGTALVTDFKGRDEGKIRPPASFVYAASVLLASGSWAHGGMPEADARAATLRFGVSLAALHRGNATNPAAPSAQQWGGPWNDHGIEPVINHGWQSALWASLVARGMSLLRDDLTPEQWEYVRRMVAWEADKFDSVEPPAYGRGTRLNYAGDSKAEENAWNSHALVTALDVFGPDEPRFEKWFRKAVRFAVSATATQRGTEVQDSLNGVNLGDLSGWNLNADGTVTNHVVPHPNYMIAATLPGIHSAAVFASLGWPAPEAFALNAELVYDALQSVEFSTDAGWASPGGTMYRPGSGTIYYPDSGLGDAGAADKAAMDAAAACLGLPSATPATNWLDLHLTAALAGTSGDDWSCEQMGRLIELAEHLPGAIFSDAPIVQLLEEINV